MPLVGGRRFLLRRPCIRRRLRRSLRGLVLLLRRLDEVVVAALLLEQLREMDLAVEDAVERGVGGGGQDAAPVRALEAALVVGLAFQRHLNKKIKSVDIISCSDLIR
jgi:hypothetical protein